MLDDMLERRAGSSANSMVGRDDYGAHAQAATRRDGFSPGRKRRVGVLHRASRSRRPNAEFFATSEAAPYQYRPAIVQPSQIPVMPLTARRFAKFILEMLIAGCFGGA